jgi:GNAT superfamily N-acetyltransferase
MEGVRPAEPADRPACDELLSAALAHTQTMRGGATLAGPVTASELLERWCAPDSGVALFVGVFQEAVVGLLAVTTFTRPGATAPSGRVECCYVEEAARGVGVGSALMDAALDWCGQRECLDIDARALPGDRATKQRLEAAGFTARLLTLNRRLR